LSGTAGQRRAPSRRSVRRPAGFRARRWPSRLGLCRIVRLCW
jgi:hypothetical protein